MLPEVPFDGYDDFVHGLDVAEGWIWIATDDHHLRSFEIPTGAAGPVHVVAVQELYGLECHTP